MKHGGQPTNCGKLPFWLWAPNCAFSTRRFGNLGKSLNCGIISHIGFSFEKDKRYIGKEEEINIRRDIDSVKECRIWEVWYL